jgi:hypothetical protein
MKSKFAAMLICLAALGCGRLPPVTEVEGTVYLNGKPLPKAMVRFVPDLEGFSGDLSSSAVTDEQGCYRLKFLGKDEDGAFVARHFVMVTEPPPPPETRGPSEEAQKKLAKFLSALKNRPIPEDYANTVRTPLTVVVSTDKKTYDLQLSRK